MQEVLVAGAARTAMGGFQGVFGETDAAALGGAAISAALADAGARPETVEELLMGCVLPAG
ncbi:MAG: acetyl-CoA C-acetyltransferase, partial [Rhodobacteraceae bacterium]|nr:acetyl-CoA C-acetyltransferase [Paracoccaceae bacterium]